MLSYMVNYNSQLDRTFAALGAPTRRAILARLESEDRASLSALAQPFAIKLPAVMKHLDVLDDAGLITRSKVGRTVTVRLRPQPMREAMDWLRRYERFWSNSLDRLPACAQNNGQEQREKHTMSAARPMPKARKPKRGRTDDDPPDARAPDQGAALRHENRKGAHHRMITISAF